MEIREIRRDELESLVDDLWLPFAEEMAEVDAYNTLVEDVRDGQLDYKREQFDTENVVIYVAIDDEADMLLGYALAEHGESPPVFQRGSAVTIKEIYVVPPVRNNGIASALMAQIERWAADQGAERVTLSVNRANEPALSLYRRRGYLIRRHKMDKPIRVPSANLGDRERTVELQPNAHRTAFREFAERAMDEYGEEIHEIILFGSTARGEEQGIESDVDIYVICDTDSQKRSNEIESGLRDIGYEVMIYP